MTAPQTTRSLKTCAEQARQGRTKRQMQDVVMKQQQAVATPWPDCIGSWEWPQYTPKAQTAAPGTQPVSAQHACTHSSVAAEGEGGGCLGFLSFLCFLGCFGFLPCGGGVGARAMSVCKLLRPSCEDLCAKQDRAGCTEGRGSTQSICAAPQNVLALNLRNGIKPSKTGQFPRHSPCALHGDCQIDAWIRKRLVWGTEQ